MLKSEDEQEEKQAEEEKKRPQGNGPDLKATGDRLRRRATLVQ